MSPEAGWLAVDPDRFLTDAGRAADRPCPSAAL